jgi:hypothetical protein
MKPKTKSQLAAYMTLSSGKLQKILNEVYFEELEALGYCKTCKILSPKIVKFVLEAWGMEEFDND